MGGAERHIRIITIDISSKHNSTNLYSKPITQGRRDPAMQHIRLIIRQRPEMD